MKTIPIAKSIGKHAQKTKPEKKTFFETPCPQSQQGGGDGKCPSKKVEWKCAQCFDIVSASVKRRVPVLRLMLYSLNTALTTICTALAVLHVWRTFSSGATMIPMETDSAP